jgi:hypothetical protein
MENKYNNGKIYKIEPLNGIAGDIYIGSTTQELNTRMIGHRSDYKRWLNGKRNSVTCFTLFNKYNINNCSIVLLEFVNVSSKIELLNREAFYISSIQCVNKHMPGRTQREWIELNKDKLKEYQKKYVDDYPEYKKQYYQDNKENIKQKTKTYQKLNKDIVNQRNRERYHRKKFEKAELEKENQLNKVMGGCIDL